VIFLSKCADKEVERDIQMEYDGMVTGSVSDTHIHSTNTTMHPLEEPDVNNATEGYNYWWRQVVPSGVWEAILEKIERFPENERPKYIQLCLRLLREMTWTKYGLSETDGTSQPNRVLSRTPIETIETSHVKMCDARTVENIVKHKFDEHRQCGEFFDLDSSQRGDLMKYVEDLISNYGLKTDDDSGKFGDAVKMEWQMGPYKSAR
jgi:hypothetical protein